MNLVEDLKAATAPHVCATCRLWVSTDKRFGECRRFPPVPLPDGTWHLPVTPHDFWCGEFKWRNHA